MSLKQVEFQLLVLRKRIHVSALDIHQTFEEIVATYTATEPTRSEQVRDVLRRIKADKDSQPRFAANLEKRQKDLKHLINAAVSTATKLFHHAETLQGAVIGRQTVDRNIWVRIFNQLIRVAYINPDMYIDLRLSDCVRLIEGVLDDVIYGEVPLLFQNTSATDFRDVTPAALADFRPPQSRDRVAPSVLSIASDLAGPPRPYRQEIRQEIRPETRPDQQERNSPVGSVVTARTHHGQMNITIPVHGKK